MPLSQGEFDGRGARKGGQAAVGVAGGGPTCWRQCQSSWCRDYRPYRPSSGSYLLPDLTGEYVLQLCRQDVNANCSHSSTLGVARWREDDVFGGGERSGHG